MIGLGFAILALFSLAGIFAGGDEPRRGEDPRDDPMYWTWARR